MNRKPNFDLSNENSWRRIEQKGFSHSISESVRILKIKKRLKQGSIISLIIITLIGIGWSANYIKNNHQYFNIIKFPQPVRHISYRTTGVLSREWLDTQVDFSQYEDMMEINLVQIKSKLEKLDQIKSVSIKRNFPDEIQVYINELEPIMRYVYKNNNNVKELYLISMDGQVYKGHNYSKDILNKLPFIKGVDIILDGNNNANIDELNSITELLLITKKRFPRLYDSWNVISYNDFKLNIISDNSVIVIKGDIINETLFMPYNFDLQLNNLANVIQFSINNNTPKINRIDLTLNDRVNVKFD